ncbi:Hypothetical protein KVN_LOCUS423 [uncultured virus]|nr:Hypothetical protein KVN_LOCUS423 [uncultured virus]
MTSLLSLFSNSIISIDTLIQFSKNKDFLRLVENLHDSDEGEILLKEFITNIIMNYLDGYASKVFENKEFENVFKMETLSKKEMVERYLCKIGFLCMDDSENNLSIELKMDKTSIVEIIKKYIEFIDMDFDKINSGKDIYVQIINNISSKISDILYPIVDKLISHNLTKTDHDFFLTSMTQIIKEINKILEYQSPFIEPNINKRKRNDESKNDDFKRKK